MLPKKQRARYVKAIEGAAFGDLVSQFGRMSRDQPFAILKAMTWAGLEY